MLAVRLARTVADNTKPSCAHDMLPACHTAEACIISGQLRTLTVALLKIMPRKSRVPSTLKLAALSLVIAINSSSLKTAISQDTLNSTSTPNEVQSLIATLQFVDGAPLPETTEKVYDYLDTARAMDSYLRGMPGASVISAT